ncbi:MAG: bifunctional transaldolase/phosoglucose isomerase [Gammaproteobacteria bacterium]|nr:bifunctional transaldolase/phosoglucose isomerase [Gammaproteobacteria bacterium]
MNPLHEINGYGQSVWLDYIRRNLLIGGELERLITEDRLKGVTSNPAIFEKAIAGSSDYAEALKNLGNARNGDAQTVYEKLALEDIRIAADLMRPVYEATRGRDGYVSMEVSPGLANDTKATCEEARRLWRSLGRDNVMIKVPATPAGIPAIETLLGEGININVTLLFSRDVYEQVAKAYLRGLERLAERGADLARVASVASFFVSRIDTAVDTLIDERLSAGANGDEAAQLRRIQGQVAVANAKLAYQRYKTLFSGARWQTLAARGAQTQRLLWASTGVKNPAHRDVRYVEELIGPDTVNTVPPATLDAFRHHGQPRSSLEEDIEAAEDVLRTVERLGISFPAITNRLLREGVQLFVEAFDKLLVAVAAARSTATPHTSRLQYRLPFPIASAVEATLDEWQQYDKIRRLWARDASLWTGADEARWLDWLDVTGEQLHHLGDLRRIGHAVEGRRFTHAVLLGMGGSSLAPEMLSQSFGVFADHPRLLVLDSTDPAAIKSVENRVELARTLFLVSSKSGSTLEPDILMAYFHRRVVETVGADQAGRHFAVVTDPGSALERRANAMGFRRVFHGVPGIGGRYSALSNFGMVPAAGMGIDVQQLLDRAQVMVEACAACVPAHENPGVALGAVLGAAARHGRDKITLVTSPGITAFGAWLEQLLAESTGKQGKGLIPVDGELPGSPELYGNDRLFVYLRLASAPDAEQDAAVERLEQAGQPVVRITLSDVHDLGQEFFRWEIATAVAGSILGIHPFDQPDVEASKIATRELTMEFEARGTLPQEAPFVEESGLKLFADEHNARTLRNIVGAHGTCRDYLKAHLGRLRPGDYFALLAFLARHKGHEHSLQAVRHHIRDRHQVATCLGFGPRFLHSTGQAYKGGPNSGVFLQITCDDAEDIPVPGHAYTFGVVKAAQARGDFQVLADRQRRLLRVHLGRDTLTGLAQLQQWLT